MNELQLRKQALVLESELNRLSLRGACDQLHQATDRLARPTHLLRHRKSALWILAALAGWTLARRRRTASKGTAAPKSRMSWLRLLPLVRVLTRL